MRQQPSHLPHPHQGVGGVRTLIGGIIPDVGHTSVASRGDPTGPPAFVFDIDGVLIRGKDVLPTAKKAMAQVGYFIFHT